MAQIVGMLIFSFIVRAIILACTFRWKTGGTDRILLANVISWILVSALYGVGVVNDTLFIYWPVLGYCGVIQLVWLIFDNVRFAKGKGPEPERSMADPPEAH